MTLQTTYTDIIFRKYNNKHLITLMGVFIKFYLQLIDSYLVFLVRLLPRLNKKSVMKVINEFSL